MAVEIGLLVSDVLSTFAKPTIDFVIPLTVPVNVGLFALTFPFKAVCVAIEIGLFASEVLSTFAKPTIALDIPLTVPVNVGLLIGAFAEIWPNKLLICVSLFMSSFCNSINVS